MEELRKSYTHARILRALLNVLSAIVLGVGTTVFIVDPRWFIAIVGMGIVCVGILGIMISLKLGEYVSWLLKLIDKVESVFIQPYFVSYWDGEKVAVKFTFKRFMLLYEIDQKKSWQIGNTRCCYDYTTKKEEKILGDVVTTTKTLRVYVWFSFFDYLKFKSFLKNREARSKKKELENRRAHEIELCKEFIQALEKDVKSYAENGPFKKEESNGHDLR